MPCVRWAPHDESIGNAALTKVEVAVRRVAPAAAQKARAVHSIAMSVPGLVSTPISRMRPGPAGARSD